MKKIYSSVLVVFVFIITGCATSVTKDIKVEVEADPKARFSGYKTYAWLGAAAIVNDPEGQWEPPNFDADKELKFLIDRELTKRGMSENSTIPDMIVAFATGVDMEALKLRENPESKISALENVPQAALIVVLIDADTGFVIWVGQADAELSENPSDDLVRRRLDYAVTEMFRLMPKD
jgi:PBP1b-binding outer membrane lipoprotein LpoB